MSKDIEAVSYIAYSIQNYMISLKPGDKDGSYDLITAATGKGERYKVKTSGTRRDVVKAARDFAIAAHNENIITDDQFNTVDEQLWGLV